MDELRTATCMCPRNEHKAHCTYWFYFCLFTHQRSIGHVSTGYGFGFALPVPIITFCFFDISASTHMCQVFLGLPLFRFLRGFHANACLVMCCVGFLRILYFFLKICSIGYWFVLSHGVSLLIVSGHYIFKKTKFQNHVWSTN